MDSRVPLPQWIPGSQADPSGSGFPGYPVPAAPLPAGALSLNPSLYGSHLASSGYANDMPNVNPVQPLTFVPPPPSTPRPMMAGVASSSKSNTQQPIDPVNDVTCWSEHYAEDKRPFWYNSVTKTSTYDKPACLKTAIERSAPTCAWKEFTAPDGKKYYSDGTNST